MVQDDYKVRVQEEHKELVDRITKLQSMIDTWRDPNKILPFVPKSSLGTYEKQLKAMKEYCRVLEFRMKTEEISQ